MTNALATLAEHDAHFVLCRGKRAFMKGWQDNPAPAGGDPTAPRTGRGYPGKCRLHRRGHRPGRR